MPISASVTLRSEHAPAIGRERIRLIEAVAREGSIARGARAVGLTYKAAWDALDAMANLFGQPLLATHAGGRGGGGASLTPTGLRVVQAFGRLEAELGRVLRSLEPDLAGTGISALDLMSGLLMKTSARNAIHGTVNDIRSGALSSEVAVAVSDDVTLHALLTNESVRELGLVPGRRAIVLVKASFVVVAVGDAAPELSMRNRIRGTVVRCERAAVSAEVVLDIGQGRVLAATVTADSARRLKLEPGSPAWALFDAAHAIIAVD